MANLKRASKGLRPLSRWQATLVPPVLLIVALSTYMRDRLYSFFLPRRVYEKFVFVPREIDKATSPNQKASAQNLAS